MEGGAVEVMQRCESISLNLIHQMGSKRRLSGRRVEADSLADPRRQTPIDRCSFRYRSIDRPVLRLWAQRPFYRLESTYCRCKRTA